jgi:hypothetical protein
MPEARKNTPAAVKSGPAKATTPAAPAKSAFDFSALEPVKATAPSRNSSTAVTPDKNPAVKWLEASWEGRSQLTPAREVNGEKLPATYRGEGKAVTVPADQEKEVYRLVRLAADHLKLGANVDSVDPTTGDVLDKGHPRGETVTVRFAAKTRKSPPAKRSAQSPAI